MRVWRPAALSVCLLAAGLVSVASAQQTNESTLNWAFGGTVHAVARAGNVAFVGGEFNAVALRRNATGGFAVLSPRSSRRILPMPNLHGNVNAVIPDGAGGWFVGGNFTHIGTSRQLQIAHFLIDGRLDASWNGRVNGRVFALELVGNALVVGGEFTFAGSGSGSTIPAARQNLAAFTAGDGDLLPAFSNGGTDGRVLGLLRAGPRLYVGGEFGSIAGQSRSNLAALEIPALAPAAWNPASDGPVRAIAVHQGGARLIVGGRFGAIGGTTRANIAELDTQSGAATGWNPGANAQVRALDVDGALVYAGGEFTTLGGAARNFAGALTLAAGTATAWDPNADGPINAIDIVGALVYLGGDFTNVGGDLRLHAAAVTAGGAVTDWHPAVNDPVRAIAANPFSVALGGSFEAIGGYARRNLAAINLETGRLLAWNPRTNGPVLTLAVSADGRLYAGGRFTATDQQQRQHLAAFDLSTRSLASWNPGADGPVVALTTWTTGAETTVYAGGEFGAVAGQGRSRIAAISGASGLPLASFTPGATDATVLTLDADATHLYAGGRFSMLSGGTSAHLGRVDRTTGAFDSTWTPAADDTVRTVQVNGSIVYAGGIFNSIAGSARANLAALGTAAPAAVTAWQPQPDGAVNAIAVEGNVVFIGGHFRNVDGIRRPRLAGVLASATGSGPYLLPWRPRWFGNVLDLASAPDGLVAVGEALPDLDDQEIDPVGRAAFFPQSGGGVPAAPTDLTAELDDNGALTVLWHGPVRGPRPLRYLLFAGSSPGASNLANGVDVGVLSLLRVGRVPAGTYYLRVRAVGIRGASRDSEEVMVTAGQPGCGGAPEAPGGLQVNVVGGVAAFSWSPSASPGVRYQLLAGSRPGEVAFAQDLGAATSVFVAAPQGLYYARVVAVSACGQSTTSEESVVAVGAAALLLVAPSRVIAVVAAGAVQVSWTAPAGAGSFVIEAGSAPGLADVGVIAHTSSVARFTQVPAGTYYLRVRTRTPIGLGAASDEVVLVVP